MKILNYIQAIIIAVLLVYVFVLRECTPVKETVKTDTLIITKVDTITEFKYYPKPEPDVVIDSFWTFQNVDTAEILKECLVIGNNFNKKNIYNRFLKVDTIGGIELIDTIFQNKLGGYATHAHFKIPVRYVYINTMVDTKKRLSLHIGGEIGYQLNNSMSIAPSAILITKKQHAYKASYDPFLKLIQIGGYINLTKR